MERPATARRKYTVYTVGGIRLWHVHLRTRRRVPEVSGCNHVRSRSRKEDCRMESKGVDRPTTHVPSIGKSLRKVWRRLTVRTCW
eukprot:4343719-Pleurochrysis_carterae.AAC.2